MNALPSLPVIDVEQRFAEAVRAGRPEWLWFEVAEPDWARAVATIETALREVLAHGCSAGALIDDPVALSIACYTSGTGPLLGSWIERGKLTTTAANAEMLGLHLAHNRARMAKLTAHAAEVVGALSAGGGRPVVMKGMHTAHHYFDEPAQRISSDIDLLTGAEPSVADRILAQLGYVPGKSGFRQRNWAMPDAGKQPRTLTYVHRDDPWSIDLHEGVTRSLAGGTRLVDFDALVPTVSLETWRVAKGGSVFPPPLLLAYLLVHASCSFESLTLQRQYEIGLVIRGNGGRAEFPWPAFTALCDQALLWSLIYPALRFAELLSPNLVPEAILLRSRDAAAPKVRKLAESHSAASVHNVARWSWGERYMWADGLLPRMRQFASDLGMHGHMSAREIAQQWRQRAYRQMHRVMPNFGMRPGSKGDSA